MFVVQAAHNSETRVRACLHKADRTMAKCACKKMAATEAMRSAHRRHILDLGFASPPLAGGIPNAQHT